MIDDFEFGRGKIIHGRGLNLQWPKMSSAERLRAARGVKQAVVKVRSFAHGRKGVAKIMNYISRQGALELETESGERIKSKEEQRELISTWAVDFDENPKSRDTAHIIFSMPAGSPIEALKGAVRTVGQTTFTGHEYVFAVHTDRKHVHAHMVLKMRGHDKDKKIDFRKADLYKLRERFAEASRKHGVELAASSRAARGIGWKGYRHDFAKMRQRGETPKVRQQAIKEADQEVRERTSYQKPWEKAMAERNKLERKEYLMDAHALRQEALKQTDAATRQRMDQDAALLERFAYGMPKPRTRQQIMKGQIQQMHHEKERQTLPMQNKGAELER